MEIDFDKKSFKVLQNEGPGAEVTEETYFYFQQMHNIVHADYYGGQVRMGKLLGLLEGQILRHSHIQINLKGELHSGQAVAQVHLTPEGKIRLIDEWEWKDQPGKGKCVMEECD